MQITDAHHGPFPIISLFKKKKICYWLSTAYLLFSSYSVALSVFTKTDGQKRDPANGDESEAKT